MKKQLGIMLFALVIAICFTGAVSATNGEATDGDCNSNYQVDNNVNLNDGYNTCNNEDNNLNEDNTCDNKDNNWNDNDNTCNNEDDNLNEDNTCDNNHNNWNDDDNACNNEPKCNTCKNATVGNLVWNDSNANGIQDPNEPGIEGITVNLWTNVNNAPGSIIKTTTTDANGNYWFTNVIPGSYWLQFLVPQALGTWIFSPQDQGTDDTIDSDANAAGIAGPICLLCGEVDSTWDAGLYQYAKLGDRVWNDLNANGIQDLNEPGIGGVIVNLWTNVNNAPGSIINTTTTDANGNYEFTNVIPGAYWLQFLVPQALGTWIFSPQDQGTDDTIDSDANAAGIAGIINLVSGEVDSTWDAGLYQLAAVGNRVWDDINENGIQDPTEPGVAEVIVNLWTNVNNAPGSIIKTTTTDINGDYMFTNLVPGTYWLQFIPPARVPAWIFTLLMVGNNPAIDSDANANGIAGPIELISGEVDLTWDAGLDPGKAAAGGGEEGNAAGGEENEGNNNENAAGGEPELNELANAAAGEPESVSAAEVNMQETGLPINYLILAILMVLGGLFGIKRK